MTFPTGVIEIRKCSDEDLKTMHKEGREASKRLRKLGRVMGIVADHHLQQLKHFQAKEQLATWRRTHGYDRDDSWMHDTLPFSPHEFTASLWSDLQELKDAISMAEGDRFSPRAKSFIKEIGQGTVNSMDASGQFTANMTDEEFAILKRLVENRDREAAQVNVTQVSTAQHCIPRPLNLEISSDVHVNMEEKDEGKMNPELTELKSSSAGTGLETPGQQCPPIGGIWETRRTIADGYLLVGMGSNQGGDISSPKERVRTRAVSATTPANSSNTIFRQQGHKPKDEDKGSEENKQFDRGGNGEKPPPLNVAVMVLSFFFLGGDLGHGSLVVFASCSLSLCACLSVQYLLFPSGDHCLAS